MSSPVKTPPYNTGKVLIGSMYHPQPEYHMSDFEYRLQESLLRRERRALAAVDLLCWLIAAMLLVWLFMVAK